MLTLSIRPALPIDSPAIASVMRCGSTALMRHFTIIGCTGLEAYLHNQITADSPTHYLVAVKDDRLIGMSAWRCEGEYLFLNHLFVLPSTQGRGVGTSLWSHGITHFQSRQPRYLALDVHDDNPKARSWYLALGMTVVGRKILWTSHPGNTAAETWRWPAGAEVPVRCLRPVPDPWFSFGTLNSSAIDPPVWPLREPSRRVPSSPDHHTTHVPRKLSVASRRPAGLDSFPRS